MAKLTIEVDLVAIESVSDLKKFHKGLGAFIQAIENADDATKALSKVFPAGGPPPLPRAEPNDPQIAKAEDAVKLIVEAAKVLEPSPVEQKAPAATAPVTPTIPKAVMPNIPKAVMPNIPKATVPAAPAPAASHAPAPAASYAPATAPAPAPSVTIKDLRDLMATKVTKHVEALRNKLAEYGSANISNLNPQHYDEFYAFLNSLPNE